MRDNRIEYTTRYSSTDQPDLQGRWARVAYFRGLQIGWFSKTGDGNNVVVTGNFPIDGAPNSKFVAINETYEGAKVKLEKAWTEFRESIA